MKVTIKILNNIKINIMSTLRLKKKYLTKKARNRENSLNFFAAIRDKSISWILIFIINHELKKDSQMILEC